MVKDPQSKVHAGKGISSSQDVIGPPSFGEAFTRLNTSLNGGPTQGQGWSPNLFLGRLFALSHPPQIYIPHTVRDAVTNKLQWLNVLTEKTGLSIFNRSFSEDHLELWNNLMHDFLPVSLDDSIGGDIVSVLLEKTGRFTTQSLYRFITHGDVSSIDQCIWDCKLPQKIEVFLWKMYRDKLQASAVLARRDWKGNKHNLYGVLETIDHIFFTCPLGKFVWCCIRDACG